MAANRTRPRLTGHHLIDDYEDDNDWDVLVEHLDLVKLARTKKITTCWSCVSYKKYGHTKPSGILKTYTGREYRKLNEALRNGNPSLHQVELAMALCHYVWSRVEKLPDRVYRSVHFTASDRQQYKKANVVIYWNGFTSTSKTYDAVYDFGSEFKHNTLLIISLPRGLRNGVADISADSEFPNENEVLISATAGFRITEPIKSFTKKDSPWQYVVELELVADFCIEEMICNKCQNRSDNDAYVTATSTQLGGMSLSPSSSYGQSYSQGNYANSSTHAKPAPKSPTKSIMCHDGITKPLGDCTVRQYDSGTKYYWNCCKSQAKKPQHHY